MRIEIATALNRGIRVIPVLVDGASMPRSRVDRLKVSFLSVVEAKLDSEQLGLEQPVLDDILDGLLRFRERLVEFFIIKELDCLIDLSSQKRPFGLLV